jgi:hypothetical protein
MGRGKPLSMESAPDLGAPSSEESPGIPAAVGVRDEGFGRVVRSLFALVGVVALGLGLLDAGSATGLAPRVFGALLAFVGGLSLLAATGGGRPWRAWPAWAAAVAVLSIGLIGSLMDARDALTYGWLDRRHLTIALAIFVLGVVMIALVWRDRPDLPPRFIARLGAPNKTPLENLKDAIELLGVTGLLLAATGFWYTNVYVPSSRLPAVNGSIVLSIPNPSADTVHAQFTIKNPTDFRIRILASTYNMYLAPPTKPYDGEASRCIVAAQGGGYLAVLPGSTGAAGRGAKTFLNAGRLVQDGYWLEPEEEMQFGIVAQLPPGARGRVLRVDGEVTVARGDRVDVVADWEDPTEPPYSYSWAGPTEGLAAGCADPAEYTHAGTAKWPVVEESLYNRWTREPLRLESSWYVDDAGALSAFTAVVKDGIPMPDVDPNRADFDEAYQLAAQRLEPKFEQLFGLVRGQWAQEIAIPSATPSAATSSAP